MTVPILGAYLESKAYVRTAFQFELVNTVVTIDDDNTDTSNTLSTETFKLCIDIHLPDSLAFPAHFYTVGTRHIGLQGHHFGLLNDIFCLNNTYINSDLSCVTSCPSGLLAFGTQFSGRACLENGTECDIDQGCRPLTPGCTKSLVTSTTSEVCRLCEPPRELYDNVCNQPTTPDTTVDATTSSPSGNLSSSSSSDSNDPVVIGASVGAAAVVIGGGAAAYFLYYRGAGISSAIYKNLL